MKTFVMMTQSFLLGIVGGMLLMQAGHFTMPDLRELAEHASKNFTQI